MDRYDSEKHYFEGDSGVYSQPVELMKNRVMCSLEGVCVMIQLQKSAAAGVWLVRETKEKRITAISLRSDKAVDEDSSNMWAEERMADAAWVEAGGRVVSLVWNWNDKVLLRRTPLLLIWGKDGSIPVVLLVLLLVMNLCY